MNKTLRLFTLLAAVLAISLPSARAQAPTTIPVTGNLGSIAGQPAPDAYAQVQLLNCSGGFPTITGYQGIVQTSYQFVADTNGNVNGTIWPNDLITCSGTTGATVYSMNVVVGGTPVGSTQCYQIVSTQGTWNLTTQQPVSCAGGLPNPQDATYRNLVVTGYAQLPGNPSSSLQAAPKQYVDTSITTSQQNAVTNVVNVDNMTGADLGAKINAAVSYCQTTFSGGPCALFIQKSGTIPTQPNLPMGYTLSFNPNGIYTLSTEWMIQHRGVSVYFNHAKFYCTLDNGSPCIFVGKGIAATVNVSGTSVTWVSGTNFSAVDSGDQICWTGPTCANVATVNSSTSLTLTASGGTANFVSANFGMIPNFGLALPNTGAAPLLQDLDIVGTAAETNVNDVGVQIEGVAGMTIRGLTVTDLVSGRCLLIAGSLVGHYYDVHCNVDGGGVQVDQNTVGPVVTGSNANQFYGLSLYGGGTSNWNGLTIQNGCGGTMIYGFYVEGTSYHYTAYENNGGSYIQISDWERNTPSSGVDFYASGAGGVITGPAAVEGGATTGFSILASSTLVLRDMQLAGTYTTPISTASGTTVRMVNVTNSSTGTYSLATGTVTQEDPAGNYTVNLVNSRTGYQVNGVALASTHLSDSASLLRTSSILSGTSANIGGAALTVNQCASGTVTVTGAATSMHVFGLTPTTDPNPAGSQDYDWYAKVTGANTVTVNVCAIVAGTPAATTYNFLVY